MSRKLIGNIWPVCGAGQDPGGSRGRPTPAARRSPLLRRRLAQHRAKTIRMLHLGAVMLCLLASTFSREESSITRAAERNMNAALQVAMSTQAARSTLRPLHQALQLLPGTMHTEYEPLQPSTMFNETTIFPSRVDLSRYAPPVGDQGWVGSCVAWASIYTLTGWYINKDHLATGYMSPMFTYSHINKQRDTGSWDFEVLKSAETGMLPQSLYPQGNYAWRNGPTKAQIALAKAWTITGFVYDPTQNPHIGDPRTWHTDPNAVRTAIERELAAGHPALIGMAVYPDFENATATRAWIAAPSSKDVQRLAGYHEVTVIGYDNAGAWVENSWGTGWALNGFAEVSWPYLEQAVTDVISINGLHINADTPARETEIAPTPSITATIVQNGIPRHGATMLTNGYEVVWTARGFQPGEVVSLSWDGKYRSYLIALPDGTWTLEWYDHQDAPITGHNLHPTPGTHHLAAQGSKGSKATVTITTA